MATPPPNMKYADRDWLVDELGRLVVSSKGKTGSRVLGAISKTQFKGKVTIPASGNKNATAECFFFSVADSDSSQICVQRELCVEGVGTATSGIAELSAACLGQEELKLIKGPSPT